MIHVIYGTKIYVLETQVVDLDILCKTRVGWLFKIVKGKK